jgi:hypothetical protein
MSDQLPAFVRTLVPIVVGPLVARFGFDVTDPDTLALVIGVVSYLWWVVVHTVELKWPQFGYLLGIAKAPAYSSEPAPSPGPGEDVEAVVVPDGGHAELALVLIVATACGVLALCLGWLPR